MAEEGFTSISVRTPTLLWFSRLKGEFAEMRGRTVGSDEFLQFLLETTETKVLHGPRQKKGDDSE